MLLLTKGELDFCFSFFLEELISIPTGVTSKTVTLTDHIFINYYQRVSQCDVNELGISDHDLVYYTKTAALLNPNKHDISVKLMKNYIKDKLLESLSKTDLPDYMNFNCLDKAY